MFRLLCGVLFTLMSIHVSAWFFLPKYRKYGNINRVITSVSNGHADWIKSNCGVRRPELSSKTRGPTDPKFKIFGGQATDDYDFPWAVGLEIRKSFYELNNVKHKMFTRCSGTLISRKHVLSAQHCFINLKEMEINGTLTIAPYQYSETKYKAIITLGKGNRRSQLQYKTRERARFIFNYSYYNNVENDWVLLELKRKVPKSYLKAKAMVPICLPQADSVVEMDDLVETYGQGKYSSNVQQFGIMRYAHTKIYKFGKPDEFWNTIATDTDLKTSAGDSGGGLTKRFPSSPKPSREQFYKNVLVGIPVTVKTNEYLNITINRTYAVDVRRITNCLTSLTGILPYQFLN